MDAISIWERPTEIEVRAVPGHWEGDLIGGPKSTHMGTLVERHSHFTTLIKVPSKDAAVVVAALSRERIRWAREYWIPAMRRTKRLNRGLAAK
jgi:IS30 family transposase